MNDHLFIRESLDNRLSEGQRGAALAVDEISEGEFLASSDDEIFAYVLNAFRLEPIVLYEDQARLEQHEKQIDVSGDSRRFFRSEHGPHFVPGTEITIHIPFTGHSWIWQYKTNPWTTIFPRGTIISPRGNEPGLLIVTVHLPHDADPAEFKQNRDRTMELIRVCIERSTNQIDKYDRAVEGVVRAAISARRLRLKKHANLAELLDIPLKEKAGAPDTKKIPLKIVSRPQLTVPPKEGLRPEPGIDVATYEHILKIVRHEGRSFETAPSTFAKHGEEELRDIILAHLNGHFEGGATAETFRRTGKTDIRIEEQDRSAFVAECKIWRGSESFKKSIDQLLGYLTWRDSKAALIVFNTEVAQFTDLVPKIRDALVKHPLLVNEMKCGHEGEFRAMMRSVEDSGRRVTVHTFLFNLHL